MHGQQNVKIDSQISKISFESFGIWRRVDWPPTGVIIPDAPDDVEAHNKSIKEQDSVH